MSGRNLTFSVIALSVILISVSVASTKIYGPGTAKNSLNSSPITKFFEGLGNAQQQGTFDEPTPIPTSTPIPVKPPPGSNPPPASGGSSGGPGVCQPEIKYLHPIFTYQGERYGRNPSLSWYWIPPSPGVDIDGLNKFKPKLQAVHADLQARYKDYFGPCTTSAECDAKNKEMTQKPLSDGDPFNKIFDEFKKVFYSPAFENQNWESVMNSYYNHKYMGIIPCPFKITPD